jgi:hypothetical protein
MQNPFEKVLRAKDSQKRANNTLSTAQKLYTHKPFFERWHAFKGVCNALTYLCQIISPLPAFAVFFFLFWQSLSFIGSGGIVLSVCFSVALALGIEFTKRYSTKNALIDFFNYRTVGLGLAVAFICSSVSIGTSFYGAYILPSKLTTAPTATAPDLVDIGQLQTNQAETIEQKAAGIDSKRQEISTYEKNNKSSSANRMSRRAGVLKGYNTLKTQLHTLERELSTLQSNAPDILENARTDNKNALQDETNEQTELTTAHNLKTSSEGLVLGYLSLGLELVYWLAMVFVFWYYRRCKTEFEPTPSVAGSTPEPTTTNHHHQPQQTNQPTTSNQPHQIGFITDFSRLANGCTTITDNGVLQLVFEGKTFPIERLRNNYHANNSKVKRYTRENKPELADKYKNASLHWANLIKILEQKTVSS